MIEPANKPRAYKLLAYAFCFGALVWFVGVLLTGKIFFFGFLGLLNLGLAYLCWQNSQQA